MIWNGNETFYLICYLNDCVLFSLKVFTLPACARLSVSRNCPSVSRKRRKYLCPLVSCVSSARPLQTWKLEDKKRSGQTCQRHGQSASKIDCRAPKIYSIPYKCTVLHIDKRWILDPGLHLPLLSVYYSRFTNTGCWGAGCCNTGPSSEYKVSVCTVGSARGCAGSLLVSNGWSLPLSHCSMSIRASNKPLPCLKLYNRRNGAFWGLLLAQSSFHHFHI